MVVEASRLVEPRGRSFLPLSVDHQAHHLLSSSTPISAPNIFNHQPPHVFKTGWPTRPHHSDSKYITSVHRRTSLTRSLLRDGDHHSWTQARQIHRAAFPDGGD